MPQQRRRRRLRPARLMKRRAVASSRCCDSLRSLRPAALVNFCRSAAALELRDCVTIKRLRRRLFRRFSALAGNSWPRALAAQPFQVVHATRPVLTTAACSLSRQRWPNCHEGRRQLLTKPPAPRRGAQSWRRQLRRRRGSRQRDAARANSIHTTITMMVMIIFTILHRRAVADVVRPPPSLLLLLRGVRMRKAGRANSARR